jgi:hypothetical protein
VIGEFDLAGHARGALCFRDLKEEMGWTLAE